MKKNSVSFVSKVGLYRRRHKMASTVLIAFSPEENLVLFESWGLGADHEKILEKIFYAVNPILEEIGFSEKEVKE